MDDFGGDVGSGGEDSEHPDDIFPWRVHPHEEDKDVQAGGEEKNADKLSNLEDKEIQVIERAQLGGYRNELRKHMTFLKGNQGGNERLAENVSKEVDGVNKGVEDGN